MLSGIDEEIAEDNGLFFRQFSLGELASNPSHIRDYVVHVYVNPNDGLIDIPVYLIETSQGEIQASGVIRTTEELSNLISSHKRVMGRPNHG